MCGDPEQPVFSIVNRTSPSTVQYACVKGHRMEGGTGLTRHCSNKGDWNGSPPKCVGKISIKNELNLQNMFQNTIVGIQNENKSFLKIMLKRNIHYEGRK